MMKRAGLPGVHIPAYSADLEKVHSKDNSQGQEFCISIPDLLTCPSAQEGQSPDTHKEVNREV